MNNKRLLLTTSLIMLSLTTQIALSMGIVEETANAAGNVAAGAVNTAEEVTAGTVHTVTGTPYRHGYTRTGAQVRRGAVTGRTVVAHPAARAAARPATRPVGRVGRVGVRR